MQTSLSVNSIAHGGGDSIFPALSRMSYDTVMVDQPGLTVDFSGENSCLSPTEQCVVQGDFGVHMDRLASYVAGRPLVVDMSMCPFWDGDDMVTISAQSGIPAVEGGSVDDVVDCVRWLCCQRDPVMVVTIDALSSYGSPVMMEKIIHDRVERIINGRWDTHP